MKLILRSLMVLLLGACTVPDFSIAPDTVNTNPIQSDPCAIQKATGQLCGGNCPACADGESCAAPSDCASGLCTARVCVPAPTCSDGQTNGTETDLDCGGACTPCPLKEHCTHDADCSSALCVDAKCAAAAPLDPSCADGSKNGTETDVDCGGSCSPCAVNQRCAGAADCQSLVCASVCQPPGCADGVRNGAESDTDCGGSCTPCAVKLVCNTNADCASGSCASGHCLAPTCSDAIKNGDETGTDCGGSCTACPAQQGCAKAADCQSLVCAANKTCSAPSCTDGVRNGTESDTDCGTGCAGCGSGLRCAVPGDCASGICNQSYCVPAAPTGGSLVMSGWIATASDTFGNSTTSSAIDTKTSTRWSSGTDQAPGMWFEVDMLKPQIFWSLTLDSADSPADGPQLFDVYLSTDGTFGAPALQSIPGGATGTCQATFKSAQVARYIKLMLTSTKTTWWSIRELSVNK
jgi:hypothetical protein